MGRDFRTPAARKHPERWVEKRKFRPLHGKILSLPLPAPMTHPKPLPPIARSYWSYQAIGKFFFWIYRPSINIGANCTLFKAGRLPQIPFTKSSICPQVNSRVVFNGLGKKKHRKSGTEEHFEEQGREAFPKVSCCRVRLKICPGWRCPGHLPLQ